MRKETCQLCGYKVDPGPIERHHIVPAEVTEKAGIPESKIVGLCCNCHQELHKFYPSRVADMAYNTKIKRFRVKSPLEMVTQYEAAYRAFTRYKKEQRKRD